MNKLHFVLSRQVTFNMRIVWSKRKDQKREKSLHKVQRRKGEIYVYQLHFFPLETQFLLYDHTLFWARSWSF